jgi:hypothetical protein
MMQGRDGDPFAKRRLTMQSGIATRSIALKLEGWSPRRQWLLADKLGIGERLTHQRKHIDPIEDLPERRMSILEPTSQ